MTTSESKGRFFCKTNRFESISITNRIEPIRIVNWNALVSTRLDYGNATLAGVASDQLDRLQSTMNAAARLVCSARKSDHITSLLRVTFIGYECHSESSSNSLCSFSAAYSDPASLRHALHANSAVWQTCRLSSSTQFRFDARAARSTDASHHRRRPRLHSLRSSRLERSAI